MTFLFIFDAFAYLFIRGRYFDSSTLPSPPYDWDFDELDRSPDPVSVASPLRPAAPPNGSSHDADTTTIAVEARQDRESENIVPSSQQHEGAPGTTDDGSTMTRPPSTLDQEIVSNTPVSWTGINSARLKEQRLPPDKVTTPHSPPYSPQARPSKGPSVGREQLALVDQSTDHTSSQARERNGHIETGSAPLNVQPADLQGIPPPANTHTADDRPPRPSHRTRPEQPPSPASTGDPRSTDTSRADGRSTATSPDDESAPAPHHVSGQLQDDHTIVHDRQTRDVRSSEGADPITSTALDGRLSGDVGTEPDGRSSKDVAVPTPTMQPNGEVHERALAQGNAQFPSPHDSSKRRKTGKTSYTVVLSRSGPSPKYIAMVKSLQRYGGADSRVSSSKKDYMHLLFLRQALDSTTPFKADLSSLLTSSNKTLSTSDWQTNLREKQDCTIVKRIYDWQQNNRWSLRQMKPSSEPAPPTTHQDSLMAEMKWLQTDFREERKLRLSRLQRMAQWCQQWVRSCVSQRSSLQTKPDLSITSIRAVQSEDHCEASEANDRALPTFESLNQDLSEQATAPHLAGLASGELGALNVPLESPFEQGIANRLPLFEPWKSQSPSLASSGALSAPVEGLRPAALPPGPMQEPKDELVKEEESDDELSPEDTSCALFQPEWKSLRARVNVQWAFKPPGGQMPPPGFYENRRASHWTPDDEVQLKQFAKDFPSNWNLISERLTPKSAFVSSSSRRTPWECYERLISMEGASTDPGTRQYARQFQSQMDKIKMKWSQSVQNQIAMNQAAGQPIAAPRFPVPARVERKSASKRFPALIDAARKVARKREASEANRRQTHHEGMFWNMFGELQTTSLTIRLGSTQGQIPIRGKPEALFTPQHWSEYKYKQQVAMSAKQEQMCLQQRVW